MSLITLNHPAIKHRLNKNAQVETTSVVIIDFAPYAKPINRLDEIMNNIKINVITGFVIT